jgi:hypothetical protein
MRLTLVAVVNPQGIGLGDTRRLWDAELERALSTGRWDFQMRFGSGMCR